MLLKSSVWRILLKRMISIMQCVRGRQRSSQNNRHLTANDTSLKLNGQRGRISIVRWCHHQGPPNIHHGDSSTTLQASDTALYPHCTNSHSILVTFDRLNEETITCVGPACQQQQQQQYYCSSPNGQEQTNLFFLLYINQEQQEKASVLTQWWCGVTFPQSKDGRHFRSSSDAKPSFHTLHYATAHVYRWLVQENAYLHHLSVQQDLLCGNSWPRTWIHRAIAQTARVETSSGSLSRAILCIHHDARSHRLATIVL